MPSTPPREIVVADLHKSFRGEPVLSGARLSVARGDRAACVQLSRSRLVKGR